MIIFFLIATLCILVGLLAWQMSSLKAFLKDAKSIEKADEAQLLIHKELTNTIPYLLAILIVLGLALLLSLYTRIKGTPLEGHLMEWLNLIVRWFHITIGIAWIGASFYFVFLENSLNRTKGLKKGIAGNLWAVHGGGFYYLEKYKVAPDKIPEELHWFKYEAYFTWISGFLLLWIVYYFNAEGMLIDPGVQDISPTTGIAIGVGALIISWVVYDLLCKTPLVRKGLWFSIVGILLAGFGAWFFSQFFSPRAAYIHFGAMLGTLMAGNVFFIIIPAQKAMVNAAKEGRPLNPELGKHAGLRSLHNNYLTLPVLFVMISNHFPSTFGHPYNWAVLLAISLASAAVKHYHNLYEQGRNQVWLLPIAFGMLVGIIMVTAPDTEEGKCDKEVSFTQVYQIFTERCNSCHSSQPTDELWTAPPNGVKYDTPEEIIKMKDKILQRVVFTKTMPQNNKTGMTPEERDLIRCWIEQGMRLDQ